MAARVRFSLLVFVAFFALGAALVLPHLRGAPSEAAVSRLQYSMGCLRDGRVSLYLLWSGGTPDPRQQWVDLSLQNNGWLAGTFLSAGPFGPNADYFDWNGIQPGARHYIRVNQLLQNNVWDASPTYQIDAITC
jgi:hypothetical protein